MVALLGPSQQRRKIRSDDHGIRLSRKLIDQFQDLVPSEVADPHRFQRLPDLSDDDVGLAIPSNQPNEAIFIGRLFPRARHQIPERRAVNRDALATLEAHEMDVVAHSWRC